MPLSCESLVEPFPNRVSLLRDRPGVGTIVNNHQLGHRDASWPVNLAKRRSANNRPATVAGNEAVSPSQHSGVATPVYNPT